MKLDPLRTLTKRDYALLTPGRRELYVETQWGSQRFAGKRDIEAALMKLKGFTCYVRGGLQQLRHTTGALSWVLTSWRGRDVNMIHVPSGVKVTSLRSTLDNQETAFSDLSECLTWLRGYGVAPAAISSMSWQLLRASLNHTVSIYADPDIVSPAFFGGRQGIENPTTYRNMKSIDIRAAYPTAMARLPVALSLRSVDPSTELDPNEAGLAKATVIVPKSLPYPPLPVRVHETAIQFQWGQIEGTWTWCELDAAKKLGCDVTIHESYAPRRSLDLFGTWWDIAQTGRSLSPSAANLAKAVANSTWGQFAMRGEERTEVHWSDERGENPYVVDLGARSMPHEWTLHIATEITSRVRVQTLTEGLYSVNVPVVHTDTDGIIVDGSITTNAYFGSNFGQWQIKESMKVVEIRAPQFYRYQTDADDQWQYVASGMSKWQAAETFRRQLQSSHVSYLADDMTLPPGDSNDEARIAALLAEAKSLLIA